MLSVRFEWNAPDGNPKRLGRHIDQAFEMMRLCASDPLCAEHHPFADGVTLHGAACHACLYVSETSCERSNNYLDRSVVVPTLEITDLAFFPKGEWARGPRAFP